MEFRENERRTLVVIVLTLVTMVIEIAAGYMTGSMALLADGYHMASHAGALTIAYLAYRLARSEKLLRQFKFSSKKVLPLGGFINAVLLGLIAVWMVVESVFRIMQPVAIQFEEAFAVAVFGLLINILSVFILSYKNESADHGHKHDHNHQSAVAHILADAFTSVLAMIAIIGGRYGGWVWLDPIVGVVGSIVIIQWSLNLCKTSYRELKSPEHEVKPPQTHSCDHGHRH